MSSRRSKRRLHNLDHNLPFSNSDYTASDDNGDVSGRETNDPPPHVHTYTHTNRHTHTDTYTPAARTRRAGVVASPHVYDHLQQQRREFETIRNMGKRQHEDGKSEEEVRHGAHKRKSLHSVFGYSCTRKEEEGNESGPGSPPEPPENDHRKEERQQQLVEIQHLEATILQLHEEREALEAKRREMALAEKDPAPLLVDYDPDSLFALVRQHRHLSALRHTKVLAHSLAEATLDRVRLNQQHNRLACLSSGNLPPNKSEEAGDQEENQEGRDQEKRGVEVLKRTAELTTRWMGLLREKEDVRQQVVTAMQHFNNCHTSATKIGQHTDDLDELLGLYERGELCRILYQKLLTGSVEFDPLEVGLPLSLPPPPDL